VAGQGLQRLRDAGIAVETGVESEAARRLNAGYLLMRGEGRPLVTLKLATSLDGRIATHGGDSKWITGEAARARAHLLRAEHDAVMLGSGTAVADDPALTVRLPGLADRHPLRIVLDGRLRLPLTHRLVRDAGQVPTLLITRHDAPAPRAQAYRDAGVELVRVDSDPEAGGLSIGAVLQLLGRRGLTRVLVEGGGQLAAALLRGGWVDRLAWFRAGRVIGGDGLPAVAGFGLERIADSPGFARTDTQILGEDVLERFERAG
jgi:diaminohydroxyphosphoribosylaminopyrimidine deaminase/5-amino-6-(5-phosphoribosylamino)uracil reductase